MRGSGLNWQGLMEQLQQALPHCAVTEQSLAYFKYPKRTLSVNLPVKMDDGQVRVFRGYRTVHSTARGPSMGSVRYRAGVNAHECEVLSAITTLKAAVADIPLGGATGGVDVDPKSLSEHELQGLTRRYTSELVELIGKQEDILAPGIGTTEQVMAWIYDAFSEDVGEASAGVVVGKPLMLGGTYRNKDARGRSAVTIAQRILEAQGLNLKNMPVAVYGHGSTGRRAAQTLSELGALVVAVSESDSATYASGGLDVAALAAHHAEHGTLSGFTGGTAITPEEALELDVGLLILSHDYGTINASNAHGVRARVLVEATDRAVLPEAERYLVAQGVQVIPDLIASIGGTIVNYLEWVQGASNFFWTEDEIVAAIDVRVNAALDDVLAVQKDRSVPDLRTAAYVLALDRLNSAVVMRGVYP